MCDYCGCRRSGPTAELAAEHEHLQDLGNLLHTALHEGVDASDVFDEFVRLLQMHAAKEEVGLFVHARSSTPLSDQIDALCREHDDLHRWLADGLTGPRVPDALRLLVEIEQAAGGDELDPLLLKAEGGKLPLIWLADGKAIGTTKHRRDLVWQPSGRGFFKLSVVDAEGRMDRVTVRLR